MRILWFNHRDITHPQAGGAESYIHEIAKRLVRWGHEVTLCCEFYAGASSREEIDGVEVERMGGRCTLHLLVLRVKGDGYDLIVDDIAHGIPFWTPIFVKGKPICALMMHWHGSVFHEELQLPVAIAARICEKSIPIVYRHVPWITISESTKTAMINHGIPLGNISIVSPGIDLGVYHPRPSEVRAPIVLCISRLKKYKNIGDVISAMSGIGQEAPDAKLVIVGTGDYEDSLRDLVRQLGLQDKVSFRDFVGLRPPLRDVKVRLLQQARVFVMPSSFEGFSISTLEALACGTPVVSSDIDSSKELIKHGYNGFLFPVHRIDLLQRYVGTLLTNNDLHKQMSENAVKTAQQFTLDGTATRFLDVTARNISYTKYSARSPDSD